MAYTITERGGMFDAAGFADIADLWNRNARSRHAFHPWTGELLASRLTAAGRPLGRILEARTEDGALAGFAHVTVLREDGYPNAGVLEMLLVDRAHRRRGVGGRLLDRAVDTLRAVSPRPGFIDALGAWPFGYAYNTLADGSERSGVFLREEDLYRLFLRAGFNPVKKSVVMRADLAQADPRPLPPGTGFYIAPRRDATWLDRVFRGRELWDHDLAQADGRILSRAIFGLMDGESAEEEKVVFSLFGVNTPRLQQRKGYAGVNLSRLMEHIRQLGGDFLELHVYADNEPALALYDGLGFKPLAETMMMHKLLND